MSLLDKMKLKNFKISWGIRQYLATGIVLLTISAIGFIGLFTLKLVETNAVYRKIKEAELVGRFLQVVAEDTISSKKQLVMEKVFRTSGVYNAVVFDAKGAVIVKKGKVGEGSGRVLLFTDGIKIRRVGGGIFDIGERLHVDVTLRPGSGALGEAHFTISLGDVNGYMKEVRSFIAGYAVVDSIIIILVAVYFLSRTVVWPLRRFEKAASRISKGNYSERVEVTEKNELGTLAEAFNIMAERLEEEINRLERVNKELVDTQDALMQSTTLAVVGRLSAGIAHELGNPLGAVLGYLEILSKDIADKDLSEEDQKDILSRTEKEIHRVNNIVSEFLSMLREPKVPSEPVEVNDIIKEVVDTMESSKGFSEVTVNTELAEDLPLVSIDEDKLKQVLINIFVNSADAVNRDGSIDIRSEVVKRDAIVSELVEHNSESEVVEELKDNAMADYIVITFRDEGYGISAESAPKVFEPFYTTKDVGKGTGLGLFVSNTIVKTFGGVIDFESVEGEYTEFSIFIPFS